MSETSVLVMGGGAMGSGIAFVAAKAGYSVLVIEPDAASRERAVGRIAKESARVGDPDVAARVRIVESLPQGSGASIAIEAVPENLEMKRQIFAALEAALPPDAILATNTSSLSVADIAQALANPRRAAGLHFFNPPSAMQLVEVVATAQTSDETVQRLLAFAQALGKTAIRVADTPGFVVNRVARPFYLQAMRAYEKDVAQPPELDALARAAGFRMGPFELMDLIGLDVNLATTQSVYERTGEARLAPVRTQQELVTAGRLGRKSGAGFYDYADGPVQAMELNAEPAGEINGDERVVVIGVGGIADELIELLAQGYEDVVHVESDETLDLVPGDATIVIDTGNGASDRANVIRMLDRMLGPDTILLADAYASDLGSVALELQHPQRLVGYGVLGALGSQSAVEIVDAAEVSDDALAIAEELFGAIGKSIVLVGDGPGLFLGRVVASIVNEAVALVQDDVATPDDIDVAMRLGVNYPIGPIAWGREIGGARCARILQRLAASEDSMFAPHRSLWVLDIEQEETPA